MMAKVWILNCSHDHYCSIIVGYTMHAYIARTLQSSACVCTYQCSYLPIFVVKSMLYTIMYLVILSA